MPAKTPTRKQQVKQIVKNVGSKFDKKDFKALTDLGVKNNKILRIAASSDVVGKNANSRLGTLNPGITLPSNQINASEFKPGSVPNNLGVFKQLINQSRPRDNAVKVGDQIKGLGKQYFQWGGVTAQGNPLALTGYKVPKNMRSGDSLKIGQMAYDKGTYSTKNGAGVYLGRDGTSVLDTSGKMRNVPTTWYPGRRQNNSSSGSPSGGMSGGAGGGSGSFGGSGASPSDSSSSTSAEAALSGFFGGTGTELGFGSPSFRRRRSRVQQSGSYTQGPSRLGTSLTRQSGLSIMRA
jgi:hypothetical protein